MLINNFALHVRTRWLLSVALVALSFLGFTQQIVWSDQGSLVGHSAIDEIRINLKSEPTAKRINEGFLGTNILYWIDNDEAWSSGKVPTWLKELGIKTLRFPGGEVADNYNWESNTIERKDKFPFEAKTEAERNGRLDYKEFLANAAKLGVKNIFFVVNLEGAFFQPGNLDENIERYADRAARWVKAVREAGYTVPYWEIGNESYLRSAYPLTAREYASALKVFYRKMKAANPSIKIGAIGPHSPYGDDGVGYADALGSIANQLYRAALPEGGEEPCKELSKKACAKSLGAQLSIRPPRWWDVILEEARDNFDFVVIHRYRSTRLKNRQVNFDGPLTLKNDIRDLKIYIEDRKGAKVELALTEWNTPKQADDIMTENDHLLDIAEQMGNYLEGGVDYALYWPFRIRGMKFPIVSYDGMTPRSTFKLIKLFNGYHKASLCGANYEKSAGVYVLCTQDDKSFGLLLINRTKEAKRLVLESAGKTLIFAGGEAISGDGENSVLVKSSLPHRENPDNSLTIDILPQSINGVKIESR